MENKLGECIFTDNENNVFTFFIFFEKYLMDLSLFCEYNFFIYIVDI